MGDQGIAALIGLAVYLGMKVIDRMLPTGTHFTFVERWLTKDKPKSDDTTETETE